MGIGNRCNGLILVCSLVWTLGCTDSAGPGAGPAGDDAVAQDTGQGPGDTVVADGQADVGGTDGAVPDEVDGGGTPDTSDLSDTSDTGAAPPDVRPPNPCAGACTPGEASCVDEHTGITCYAAVDGGCPFTETKDCGAGKCTLSEQGDPTCVCATVNEPTCGHGDGDGVLDVVKATVCSGVASAEMIEPCGPPGCSKGACQEDFPASENLWPQPASTDLWAVLPLGPGHVLVAGEDMQIHEMKDGAWIDRRTLTGLGRGHVSLGRGAGGTVLSAGERSVWRQSTGGPFEEVTDYDGESAIGWPPRKRVLWALDEQTFFVLLKSGKVYVRMGGQESVHALDTGQAGTAHDYRSISGTAADDVWVVGTHGGAQHWDGVAWSAAPGLAVEAGGVDTDLHGVWALADGHVYVTRGPELLERAGDTWAPVYQAPETGQQHGVWAGAQDDLWVFGRRAASHWDGAVWSTHEMPFVETWQGLNDLACHGPECWAVGRAGQVFRFTGAVWETVSQGQGGDGQSEEPWETTAIAAVSPELVYTTFGRHPSPAYLRRHVLQDGKVVEVTTWEVGPAYLNDAGARGLWARGPDDVYIGTSPAMHFDGETFTPIELPKEVADFDCSMLAGRGDDLYLALRSQPPPMDSPSRVAHRKGDGTWLIWESGDAFEIGDLWLAGDGTVYAFQMVRVWKLGPNATTKDLEVHGGFKTRIGLTPDGALLVGNSSSEPGYSLVAPAGGWKSTMWPLFGEESRATGFSAPPGGGGLAVVEEGGLAAVSAGQAVTTPLNASQFQPILKVGAPLTAVFAAAWGDIYVGTVGGGLVRFDAPWKE